MDARFIVSFAKILDPRIYCQKFSGIFFHDLEKSCKILRTLLRISCQDPGEKSQISKKISGRKTTIQASVTLGSLSSLPRGEDDNGKSLENRKVVTSFKELLLACRKEQLISLTNSIFFKFGILISCQKEKTFMKLKLEMEIVRP